MPLTELSFLSTIKLSSQPFEGAVGVIRLERDFGRPRGPAEDERQTHQADRTSVGSFIKREGMEKGKRGGKRPAL